VTPDFLGTLPGWITAASTITGVVTIIVAWWRRGISLQRLSNESEADIRDHYADEVGALRTQLLTLERHYREMLEQSDRRHAECEVARQEIRTELEGLKSQIRLASTDRVLRMESDPPPAPHARAAAHRVKKIIEGGDK
jgi:hypothetical protein